MNIYIHYRVKQITGKQLLYNTGNPLLLFNDLEGFGWGEGERGSRGR